MKAIMIRVSKLVFLVSIVAILVSIPVGAQETLEDLLSDPSCSTACWMGMVSVATTESELTDILTTAGIQYEKNAIGRDGAVFSYRILDGYTHPLVVSSSPDRVVIFVNSGSVAAIYILLHDVYIQDMVATYGTPARIVRSGQSADIAYPQSGLVFSVLEHDGNSVRLAILLDEETVNRAYVNDSTFEDFPPCSESTQLCELTGSTSPLYRVNVGGPLLDVAGMDWEEDTQTNPSQYAVTGAGFGQDQSTIDPIPPGVPEALFQSYRASSGALAWGFPVNPGYYEVRFYFNESQYTAPDQRLMDIELEGQTFANDFDIYAAADAQHAGIMRSYMVKVEDNTLNVAVDLGSAGTTRLHGIEVIPAVPDALYRVNSGGEQLLSDDASIPYWMEDNSDNETVFDTWPYGNSFGTASGGVTLLPSVPLYVPDQLFETHRFGSTNLYLDFPVPTGTYTVRLYVSEPEFDMAGQRLMSFGIDNDVYEHELDIYTAAGGKNRGMMLEYSAYISDGLLDIHAWAPSPIVVPPSVSVLQGVEIIAEDMGELIQNIQVTGSSATYAWAPDADVGNLVYTDWGYEFTDLSSHVAGYEYIRTPNNDKMLSDPTYSLSFDLTAPATVYIAYDPRWQTDPNWYFPGWLSSWTPRGDVDVVTEDNQGQGIFDFAREVYSKSFPAGQVTLGGNNAPTVQSTMYIIFAVPD